MDSNDKYSIENLNFVSNLSKEELNSLGFENYKIVENATTQNYYIIYMKE